MEKVFDLVKLALDNEIRAKAFYEGASEITSDGESQMVFIELAGMEDQHAQLIVNRFGDIFQREGFDAAGHVQQAASNKALVMESEGGEVIKRGDMRSVVEFAIAKEIGARDNYRQLASQVNREEQRALCEDLATEEQKHHDLLSNLRISMDTPLDERPAL